MIRGVSIMLDLIRRKVRIKLVLSYDEGQNEYAPPTLEAKISNNRELKKSYLYLIFEKAMFFSVSFVMVSFNRCHCY